MKIYKDCFACDIQTTNGHEYFHCKILMQQEDCTGCKSYKTWWDIYRQEEDIIKPRLKRINPSYEYKSAIPKKIREIYEEWEHEHKNDFN